MIVIRADANENIASGHVMRCLSIADALFDLGEDIVFFTSDSAAEKVINSRGFKAIRLSADWNEKDRELKEFIAGLDRLNPDILLVDSYQVTDHYLRTLRGIVRLAYIDDLNAFDYPVDIVINYAIYAKELVYPQDKKYLLGIEYAPLRKQFALSESEIKKSIENQRMIKQVLLTAGATDPYHVTEDVIREMLERSELDGYKIAVIKGRFWSDDYSNRVKALSLRPTIRGRIAIYEDIENMAEIMLESSIAVSAGGSTLYELCACCVPTITFSYADNQLGNVNGFARNGLMIYAGDARHTECLGKRIVDLILNNYLNNDILNESKKKMLTLDCRDGAKRLAYKLINEK